jgi:hypothetical protein
MVTDRRTRQDFAACMRDLVHTYVRHHDRFGGSTGWPMHDLAARFQIEAIDGCFGVAWHVSCLR